jgi:hypothetical protein
MTRLSIAIETEMREEFEKHPLWDQRLWWLITEADPIIREVLIASWHARDEALAELAKARSKVEATTWLVRSWGQDEDKDEDEA